MNNILEVLKDKNIRITPQRVTVYSIFLRKKKHFTAEEIYLRTKKEFSTISFATIYAILNLFKEKSLIKELRINFDKSYFDLRVNLHHHFLCRRCLAIFDIDMKCCLALERKEVNGHLIEDLQGYFYWVLI